MVEFKSLTDLEGEAAHGRHGPTCFVPAAGSNEAVDALIPPNFALHIHAGEDQDDLSSMRALQVRPHVLRGMSMFFSPRVRKVGLVFWGALVSSRQASAGRSDHSCGGKAGPNTCLGSKCA